MGYSLNEQNNKNVDYSEDNIELQKLSEDELKNKKISSYSQDEKAYLLAKCKGKIYIYNNGVYELISKADIQYIDLNKYELFTNKDCTKDYNEHLELCKNKQPKIIYYNSISKKECDKIGKDTLVSKDFNENYNKRQSELSKIENIGYFLFQNQDEIKCINNMTSSGLLGYGLNLI